MAQERGARTVEDALDLGVAAPRPAQARRRHAARVPSGPGVYILRDAHGQALYVGKAGDLQKRVRSYFGSRRQKPALEAALGALARVDTVPFGSELEAALVELELIRAWRPPANSRSTRPERGRYLRLGIADPVPMLALRDAPRADGALYAGPLASRRTAETALEALRDAFGLRTCRPRVPVDEGTCLRGRLGRCLAPCRGEDEGAAYAAAVGRLERYLVGRGEGGRVEVRARLAKLVAEKRFEEAARRVGDLAALDRVDVALAVLRRSRARNGILLAPDIEPGLDPLPRGARRAGARLAQPAPAGRSLGGRRQRAARAGAPARGGRGRLVRAVAARRRGRGRDDPDGGVRWSGGRRRPDRHDAADGHPRRAAADRRGAGARARARPVRREDRRDWRVLQQVEPPSGLRLATG